MPGADTCRRCANAGTECSVPGRKKRRPPPKREHLIKQIQDQAAQIQRLIEQLETSNRRHLQQGPTSPDLPGAGISPGSPPYRSPTFTITSDSDQSVQEAGPDVQEWINKARQSIVNFDGLIGLGGAGLVRGLLVDGELEEGEDEDPRDDEDEEGYSIVDDLTAEGVSPPQEKLATMPPEAAPFGLMAKLSLDTKRVKGKKKAGDDLLSSPDEQEASPDDEGPEKEGTNLGLANKDFFRPTPPDPNRVLADKQISSIPVILTKGIVSPEEVEKLFSIYFDYMNLSVSLLDPALYTAQKTCIRSPFLFTVICAIASRYYPERPDLYPAAMECVREAAGSALTKGQKNVEMVQAFILMSLYPVPARKWDDDRSWIYLGLAIRIATDLNLHYPTTAKPKNELHSRELLNRTRAWLNCFNLDRSTSSQYGKAPIIRNTDFVACHSETWWQSSPYSMPGFDVHICGYNAELKTMANFVAQIYSNSEHPTGLDTHADFEAIATHADEQLKSLGEKWFACIEQQDLSDPQIRFRSGLLKLAYGYARLVALSYGFQNSFGKGHTEDNPFLIRCFRAASDVVTAMVDDVGQPAQRIYLRHGPEAQSVFVTFASSFLVKLLQPKFSSYLTREQRVEIRRLVQKVIDLLGSPEVSIDDRHGPKLYSRFLKGLLAASTAQVDQKADVKRSHSHRAQKHHASGSEHVVEPLYDTSQSSHPSPDSGYSLSPPPSNEAMSFNQFAPPSTGVDPFVSRPANINDQDALTMNWSELFQPTLPGDNDLVQTMQSLGQSNFFNDSGDPFSWMSYQNGTVQPQLQYSSHEGYLRHDM
ncbi:hypothetical protein NEOLEDRAFT_1127315 [Neolentinus lepideus HHB14362 ss-1]|uniref:Xylanolytic transcriptional activator regulatory domain-containing protein n=1 Tax=Neolentinus lepideus HHB14362 ss-1 TaxID=1314782 RepID=A0A165VFJ8_9AGAM|nr:hypothetical protein NEOLEDRAFT_1127315 [Neolentinus lepideus HHB14362 ss-1]